MAFTQHGETKYIFAFADGVTTTAAAAAAIETSTGVAPQELQISGEPEFTAEAEGADGTVEAVAVAQDKFSFTLTGYLTDKTKFDTLGLTFTHDGKYFIVMGRQITKGGKVFQKVQLTGMCYAGISSPAI